MLKNLKNTKSEAHFNLISPILDDSIHKQPLKKFRNHCAIKKDCVQKKHGYSLTTFELEGGSRHFKQVQCSNKWFAQMGSGTSSHTLMWKKTFNQKGKGAQKLDFAILQLAESRKYVEQSCRIIEVQSRAAVSGKVQHSVIQTDFEEVGSHTLQILKMYNLILARHN